MADSSDDTTVVAPERHNRSARRGNPFSRIALYYRQVIAELRKVVWPGRKQLVTYTSVVIVFVTVVMAYVSTLDFLFGKLSFWIFS